MTVPEVQRQQILDHSKEQKGPMTTEARITELAHWRYRIKSLTTDLKNVNTALTSTKTMLMLVPDFGAFIKSLSGLTGVAIDAEEIFEPRNQIQFLEELRDGVRWFIEEAKYHCELLELQLTYT